MWIVVSKSPKRAVPRYNPDASLVADQRFARQFRLVDAVVSSREPYHYLIFARRTLAASRPNAPRVVVPSDVSTASMIQSVASQIWRAQALPRSQRKPEPQS